jgi:WD40-like Beta Propeller Repeat/RTX calcium-binding nonapeptide repeat (4 copies)
MVAPRRSRDIWRRNLLARGVFNWRGRAIAALAGCACVLLLAGSVGQAAPPSLVFRFRPGPPITIVPPPVTPVPGHEITAGGILFTSTRDGSAELYEMGASGEQQTRLTTLFGTVADPTQSAFGQLAYAALVGGKWQIFTATSETSPPTQATHDSGDDRQPRWLDDKTLVYVSNRSGNEDLWKLDTSTGAAVDLTQKSPGPDVDPAPSPDGKQIAYASAAKSDGKFDIFVLTLSTGTTVQLTHDGADNRHPSWSQSGDTLAFDRAGSGGSDIWVMNADGNGAHSLIATDADELEPSFAPGPLPHAPGPQPSIPSRLAYATNANGNYEIWAADVDGSNRVDLTLSRAGADYAPFWIPIDENAQTVRSYTLSINEAQGAGGGQNSPVVCSISYTGTEPIVGTRHDDVICGSNHSDVIRGRGGNDQIYPRGGNDTIYAGSGDDQILARGGGADTISGGGGTDTAWVDGSDNVHPDVEVTNP